MSGDLAFKETIRPPLWLIAFVATLLFSLVVAIWAALDTRAAGYSAIASLLLLIYFYLSNIHRITFDGQELHVDRAHIEMKYIGEITVLTQKEFLLARTRELDPAAFPALIYWVSRGVRLEVIDDRDRTPYWLISTKRGEELKRTLCK